MIPRYRDDDYDYNDDNDDNGDNDEENGDEIGDADDNNGGARCASGKKLFWAGLPCLVSHT